MTFSRGLPTGLVKSLDPTAVQDCVHPPFLPPLSPTQESDQCSCLRPLSASSVSFLFILPHRYFLKKFHALLTLIWHLILEGPELTQAIIWLFTPVCIFLPIWLRSNLTIRLVTHTHIHTHTHTHTHTHSESKARECPGSPVVRACCFHCWGHRFRVQSLVRELRSCKLWSVAKTPWPSGQP